MLDSGRAWRIWSSNVAKVSCTSSSKSNSATSAVNWPSSVRLIRSSVLCARVPTLMALAMRAPPLSVCRARFRSSVACPGVGFTRHCLSASSIDASKSAASSRNTSTSSGSMSSSMPIVATLDVAAGGSAGATAGGGSATGGSLGTSSGSSGAAAGVVVSSQAARETNAARNRGPRSSKRLDSSTPERESSFSTSSKSFTQLTISSSSARWAGSSGIPASCTDSRNRSISPQPMDIGLSPIERALPCNVCVARNSAAVTRQRPPPSRQLAISRSTVSRWLRVSMVKICSIVRSSVGKGSTTASSRTTGAGGTVGATGGAGASATGPPLARMCARCSSAAISAAGAGPPSS